jgi:hypothetical protein
MSKRTQRIYLDGWNAGLEEMLDLIEEMQEDNSNKNTAKALDEIEAWIHKTQNYFQLVKDPR